MDINVKRRTARAILIDSPDLLLIKRTRPSQVPYWVTIGGAVEPEDATLEDTLRREVLEEIGSQIKNIAECSIVPSTCPTFTAAPATPVMGCSRQKAQRLVRKSASGVASTSKRMPLGRPLIDAR
jgi:8-oxo-dGTP pyrophosphatase MutT (NUDIX family)